MAGPEEKFMNDRHLYGHLWTFNQCSIRVTNWFIGGPGRTWTCDRTIMSPCKAYYTEYHQVTLTYIFSILTLLVTNIKCYCIVLNIRADRHLYGHLYGHLIFVRLPPSHAHMRKSILMSLSSILSFFSKRLHLPAIYLVGSAWLWRISVAK